MGLFDGLFGSTDTTTTTQNKPWNLQSLQDVQGAAKYLMRNDIGYNPWQGPGYTPYSKQTLQGMNMMQNVAGQGNPYGANMQSLINQQMSNNGMTGGLSTSANYLNGIANGSQNVDGSMYRQLFNQSGQTPAAMGMYQHVYDNAMKPTAGMGQLKQTAQGDNLNGNPYLMKSLQAGQQQIADQMNQAAGAAGRAGSGAAASAMGNQLGNYYNNALSSNYQNERNLQMQASGMLNQAHQAGLGLQTGAAQGMAGVQGQQFGQQLGAAQGLANVQGTNIANQAGAANSMGGIYGSALDRARGFAGMAPLAEQMQYMPGQQMMGIGQMYDSKANEALQSAMNNWNANQARPWEQLGRMNAILLGQGQLGGTMTSTGPGPSTGASMLGGGLMGAGIYGNLVKSGALTGSTMGGLGAAGLGGLMML